MAEYKKRYKTRRQRRYVKLREAGFLPFEAEKLSLVPVKTPYMKKVISARKILVKRSDRKGWTPGEYSKSIKLKYYGKGWVNKQRRQKLDVWQLLRSFEDEYEVQHPAYSSPWKKKASAFNKFTNKFEDAMSNKDQADAERILRERRK